MNTAVAFIVVLGILIFVHELGHFLFAKLFKVRVLKFSLGFGPRIYSKTLGETEYQLSALPLGGYVKMFGENPDEQQDAGKEERDASFAHKPVWQRFFIVFAGPLFNLLFTLFLFFMVFAIMGLPDSHDTTKIGQVNPGTPAAAAGFQVDDTIITINGNPTQHWIDVLNLVKDSNGEKLTFLLDRAGTEVSLSVSPAKQPVKSIFGEEVGERFMIGIVRAEELFYSLVKKLEYKNYQYTFSSFNEALNDMHQSSMKYKLGKLERTPLDTLSFAHYHKYIRERILLRNVCGTHEETTYEDWDTYGWRPSLLKNDRFTYVEDDPDATLNSFITYLFTFMIHRNPTSAELAMFKDNMLRDNGDYDWGYNFSVVEGGCFTRRENAAEDVLDYISRLSELYMYQEVR